VCIHVWNIWLIFEYQSQWVKVNVTGAKKACLNIMFADGVPLKGSIVVNNDVRIVGNFKEI